MRLYSINRAYRRYPISTWYKLVMNEDKKLKASTYREANMLKRIGSREARKVEEEDEVASDE